jgi:hypothetical protein
MKKYSPTPKDIADAIKHSIPVSARDALGEGWKKPFVTSQEIDFRVHGNSVSKF